MVKHDVLWQDTSTSFASEWISAHATDARSLGKPVGALLLSWSLLFFAPADVWMVSHPACSVACRILGRLHVLVSEESAGASGSAAKAPFC